jgi:hypothetical protein
MSCPPIYWKDLRGGFPWYAHLRDAGGPNFAVIGECVGHLDGLYSVKISRKGKPDLWAYAGSVEQAKRHIERWARSHWRTVV